MPPDLVQHHIGGGIALEIDHHPHAFARAFVANVGDAFDPLVLGGFGDLLDQVRLADLIGDRGEHDALPVVAAGLDLVAATHQDRAAPGGVSLPCAMGTEDQRRGREIGAGDVFDQFFGGDRRVVHIGKAGIDHFAEVMRRHIGRHADRDPARAVDQQVGEARRQHRRLLPAAVVVVGEIDRILVEIVQQAVRHPRQPRFGVAHRGRRIGVHRAEIALAIDQRHPHRPRLRHACERVVNRAVAVRVVVTHHVADDLGALAIGSPGDKAAFLAGEQDSAVDRLQAVAHIGQRAADDHAHGIVEIARLHLVDDVDAFKSAHRCRRGRIENVAVVAQGWGRFCLCSWSRGGRRGRACCGQCLDPM